MKRNYKPEKWNRQNHYDSEPRGRFPGPVLRSLGAVRPRARRRVTSLCSAGGSFGEKKGFFWRRLGTLRKPNSPFSPLPPSFLARFPADPGLPRLANGEMLPLRRLEAGFGAIPAEKTLLPQHREAPQGPLGARGRSVLGQLRPLPPLGQIWLRLRSPGCTKLEPVPKPGGHRDT